MFRLRIGSSMSTIDAGQGQQAKGSEWARCAAEGSEGSNGSEAGSSAVVGGDDAESEAEVNRQGAFWSPLYNSGVGQER